MTGMAVVAQTHRCRLCRIEVTVNLDHVGDCAAPGRCSGTFDHPRGMCPRARGDLEHHEVLTGSLSTAASRG